MTALGQMTIPLEDDSEVNRDYVEGAKNRNPDEQTSERSDFEDAVVES